MQVGAERARRATHAEGLLPPLADRQQADPQVADRPRERERLEVGGRRILEQNQPWHCHQSLLFQHRKALGFLSPGGTLGSGG